MAAEPTCSSREPWLPNRPADSLAAISPSVGSRAQFPALTTASSFRHLEAVGFPRIALVRAGRLEHGGCSQPSARPNTSFLPFSVLTGVSQRWLLAGVNTVAFCPAAKTIWPP